MGISLGRPPSRTSPSTTQGPDGENIAEAWIGSSPDDPAVVPVIDSTDRRITYSNIPMVYVLPDDYTLTLGQPTTYRAYSVNGAPITGKDLWSVAYIDYPLQQTGGTSITFTPKQTGYITVYWGTDSTKNTRFAACYDPRVRRADHTAPVTSMPREKVTATTVGTTVPVTLTWSGSDTGWGIAKYQLERSTDRGTWKRVLGAKVKTLAVRLAPGHRYQYRVRAVDKAGNRGAWKHGAAFRPVLVGDGAGAISYGSGWTSVPDATALGGTLHTTDVATTATYAVTGRGVTWIAAKGPSHGLAKVYLDGKLVATVDLESASEAPARVVFRHRWPTKGTHVLKMVAQATASRPTVDIDGLVVLR